MEGSFWLTYRQSIFPTSPQSPVLLLLATYIIVGLLLVVTPPYSLYRLSAATILIPWTYHVFFNGNPDLAPPSISHYGFVTLVQLLLYGNYWLFINPQSPPPASSISSWPSVHYFKWAYGLLTNPRGVGKSWGVRNLPSFSRGHPGYIPSKRALLWRRCCIVVLCWSVNISWTYFMENHYWPNLQEGDYNEDKESILRRLTFVELREVLIRLSMPLQYFVPAYCEMASSNALVSIIALLLVDDPASWPPLFGDLRDAWSIRRFWGTFWHSIHRVIFVAHAALITNNLLRIPRKSPLNRALMTILIFGFSAGMHALSLLFRHPTCSMLPIAYWYCLMGLGVVLEDAVQSVVRFFGEGGGLFGGRWGHVGYVWVWVFFSWSLPKLFFPMSECGN